MDRGALAKETMNRKIHAMKLIANLRVSALVILLLSTFPLFGGSPYLHVRSSYHDGASIISNAYREEFNSNITMTVEAWVRRDRATGLETIISQGFSDSFWFGFSNDKLRFYRSGGFSANSSGSIPANQWTHVAASYDGSRVRFYIDGEAAGNSLLAHAGTGTMEAVFLGSDRGTSNFLKGSLDEVRLWNTARTSSEISATMFTEERFVANLVGAWATGSRFDNVNLIHGQSTGSPLRGDREGIVPTNLIVPTAATAPLFDGNVNTATEYARAESMVLRYRDGPSFHDAIAYLVHTADYLYIGVESARLPTSGSPSLDNVVRIFVDSNRQTPAFNPELWRAGIFLNDGLINVSRVETTTLGEPPFQITTNAWTNRSPSPSTIEGKQGNERENEITTALDFEFRIHRSILGSFAGNSYDRFALSHTDNGGPESDRWTPEGGLSDNPTTWATMCYSSTTTALPVVTGLVRVVDDLTGEYLPGIQISLDGNGVTYQTRTSSDLAWTSFNADVGYLDPLQYRLTLPTDARPAGASAGAPHLQPTVIGETEVRFAGCDEDCQLANITFRVTLPPPPVELTSFAPAEVWPEILLRSAPDEKTVPAATITVTGENLHRYLDFHFTKPHCPNNLLNCIEGIHYFPAPSVYHPSVDGNPPFIEVSVPPILPGHYGTMRLTAHDTWRRPDNNPDHFASWRNFPDLITVGDPPFPLIHGFAFINESDGHDIDDYRAAFYDQVCDPRYMVGFWAFFPIYLEFLGGGECLGMTATAQQFSRDRATGPLESGVHFANGFTTADGVMAAPKPATFNTSNFCSPAPTNVWAAIRANHGVQMSSEYIGKLLEQFHVTPLGLNLNDQLETIRARPTDWMLCIRFFDKGHCVQPLRVIDEVRDDAGNIRPGIRQIAIWDCNFPNQTRFIEINLNTNQYRYDGGFTTDPVWTGNWLFVHEVDPLYNGQRHVPSIDTLAYSLGQFGVTHLWELLQIVVSNEAEPMITVGDESRVGWDKDGEFVETGSETIPIPSFNWLLTDEDHHPVKFVHRMDRSAPVIDLHNRGGSYKIHTSHHGTIFQLFVSDGEENFTDRLTYQQSKERVLGLRFETAEKSRPRMVSPRIALSRNATDYPVAITLSEVAVPASQSISFASDPDGMGMTFDNDTSAAMAPTFTFTSVNPMGDFPVIDLTPALALPAGSRLAIASPDGNDFRNLVLTIDHNRDGIPERSLQYLAHSKQFFLHHAGNEPALSVTREANGTVVLTHPQSLSEAIIQYSESLNDDWKDLDRAAYATTVIDHQVHLDLGNWKRTTSYFRLKFAPLGN